MIEEEPITMRVFYSYASEDQTLRDQLEKHLGNLMRQGIITSWSNRNINAGEEWKKTIQTYLDEADIILFLISSDFISSDFCYSVELQNALERQRAGKAEVLPILLRPVDWEQSSFSHLPVLPVNAEPINTWPNLDKAFVEVVKGIKESVVRKYIQRGAFLHGKCYPRATFPMKECASDDSFAERMDCNSFILSQGVVCRLPALTSYLWARRPRHSRFSGFLRNPEERGETIWSIVSLLRKEAAYGVWRNNIRSPAKEGVYCSEKSST